MPTLSMMGVVSAVANELVRLVGHVAATVALSGIAKNNATGK